ncbi:MAG: hypothetical protein KKH98_08015 [Spirochaetes bacterium]|nr:hypothetical protein [Spirochaetota bacterium]
MKKYEFVGLILAIFLVITTYSFNYFYDEVNNIVNPKYVSADNFTTNISIDSNSKLFNPLVIKTSKENYYRYELVEIFANYKDLNNDNINVGQLEAKIYKGNKLIETIGDMKSIMLKYNPKLKLWSGKWPIPYNPDLGQYQVLVRAMPSDPGPVITATYSFNILGRIPKKPDNGICATVLEYGGNVTEKKIIGPDGKYGDWHNIFKWVNFTGANSFFMLGAETETYNSRITPENPFDPGKLKEVDKLAAEAKKHDLKFGAWTMTFGIQGRDYKKIGYNPSLSYNSSTGALYPSYMHISLIDEKRFNDLLKVIKRFNANPDIDYIGFDYVRTGHADGYEMAEQVIGDMSIAVPNNWDEYDSNQRMTWFARQIKAKKDEEIIAKWQWWRAHKIAETINRLITMSGTKKPVWVFTLGWEHGKQHGQDPLMFTDAGISFDAVMLYEANQAQFRQVLVDWKAYVASQQVNIIVGQTVDVKLLDSSYLIPPQEFVRRVIIGTKKIAFGGLTDGLFWHDVSRALWGRKGNYSEKEWFLTAAKSFSDFRIEKGELGTIVNIKMRSDEFKKRIFFVDAIIENQTINQINDIMVKLIPTEGVDPLGKENIYLKKLSPGEIKIITFKAQIKPPSHKYRNQYMIAVSAETGQNQKTVNFQYVNPSKYYGKNIE